MTSNKTPASANKSLFSMKHFDAERDLPIVYNRNYNIYFVGIELVHQFDTKKYSKLARLLNEQFLDTPFARYARRDEPFGSQASDDSSDRRTRRRRLWFLSANRPVNLAELAYYHTKRYIKQLFENKSELARVTEVWALNLVPMSMISRRLLTPIMWQTAGTIFAAHLAIQHGWAMNLGGGFHQAAADKGDTFCLVSDIGLAMLYIWRKHPAQKFMIIDLDAHKATGLERDLRVMDAKLRKLVYLVDVYNNSIQPSDPQAQPGADLSVQLARFTAGASYLKKLDACLAKAFQAFKPTLVIYVAGQDVLLNDQLGLMNLSDRAMVKRDELVFKWAVEEHKCPIVLLLGGGYLARGPKVLSDSVRNLYNKGLIWGGHRSGERSLTRPRQPRADNEPRGSSISAAKGQKSTTEFVTLYSTKTPTGNMADAMPPVTALKAESLKSTRTKKTPA